MFLSDMSEAEKQAVLNLAMYLMAVDGNVADEERAMLAAMAEDMEVTSPQVTEMGFDAAANAVRDEVSRETALYELIGLAYADLVFVQEEVDYVKTLARLWQIDPDKLQRMMDYVAKVMLWESSQEEPAGRVGYFFENFAARRYRHL